MGVADGDAGDRVVAGTVWVTWGTVNDQVLIGLAVLERSWTGGTIRSKTMNTYGRSLPTTRTFIDHP